MAILIEINNTEFNKMKKLHQLLQLWITKFVVVIILLLYVPSLRRLVIIKTILTSVAAALNSSMEL